MAKYKITYKDRWGYTLEFGGFTFKGEATSTGNGHGVCVTKYAAYKIKKMLCLRGITNTKVVKTNSNGIKENTDCVDFINFINDNELKNDRF